MGFAEKGVSECKISLNYFVRVWAGWDKDKMILLSFVGTFSESKNFVQLSLSEHRAKREAS